MKTNQKCIRLSDKVCDYIDAYRGDNFSQKLENFVLDTEERRSDLLHDWEMLQAQISDKHAEMKRVQAKAQRMREVDYRMKALSDALVQLLEV